MFAAANKQAAGTYNQNPKHRTMETNEKLIRNRVQLMGNLGKDPEVREFDGGKKMARFSVATNERFAYGDGQFKEDTQWHGIVAWGKVAAQAAEHLRKGSRITLEGRLVHRNYDGKDGQKRYITEVVMNSFQVLEGSAAVAEAA
jgi:single-strand DNA-binding protein